MVEYKVKVDKYGTCWCNLKDQLHREDGPAVERKNGDKSYYLNGKLHRKDGPAVENINGYKAYYINGQPHREDGPAQEYTNGGKYYFINGYELTKQEFNNRNKTCEGKVVEIDGVKYTLTIL